LTISKELEAKILRYHFVECWGPHTIATQLGIHHSAVARVLSQAGMPKAERTQRVSIIDPYLPFITETLAQYPKLTATRLYANVVTRVAPANSGRMWRNCVRASRAKRIFDSEPCLANNHKSTGVTLVPFRSAGQSDH